MAQDERMPKDRFADLVKLHVQGRRYLSREAEERLLEEAVSRHDLSLAEAEAVLRGAARDAGIASEAEVSDSSLALLRTFADSQGRVKRADFERVVAFYRSRTGGLSPEEVRRRVKALMEENDLKPRRAGRILPTRRWYRAIES
jgi:hypothetical protein